ncbi:MAG: isocitrate/isopropylmalate family dehydrogenase [Planctomycetota bacterium]|jgi:3-isopropylmalate dehydrogenase|nr:isocitrate/isopropylmalate family dehydrogenase [Planctomycetota bacterium]
MKTHRIAVIAGDGIGPEVVAQGLRVLHAAADRFGFQVDLVEHPFGTEHWLKTEEVFPDDAFEALKSMDAILLGAIGDPRAPVGLIERGIIGRLRWDLDLWVNLRPIKLLDERFCPLKGKTPADIDMVVVRENTEDAYVQKPTFENEGTEQEIASQPMLYTYKGTERIIRYAFETAMGRPRKHLTLIDKANAVRAQSLYTRIFAEMSKEFPEVETAHLYVDAACMRMVESPESIDVAVTTNLFGDIVTDLGAMLQGGMGVAASANLRPGEVSLFESVHGSFPQAAGKNIANPIATINAISMMLDYLGEKKAAAAVEGAIAQLLISGQIRSLEVGEHSTNEIGTMVVEAVAAVTV